MIAQLITALGLLILGAALAYLVARASSKVKDVKAKRNVEIASDLDAILTKTVAFRFGGRVHYIPPMSVQTFVEASSAMANLEHIRRAERLSEKELLDGYENVFSAVCPTIKRKDIENMAHQQVGVLFQLVCDTMTGKVQSSSQKKSPSFAETAEA